MYSCIFVSFTQNIDFAFFTENEQKLDETDKLDSLKDGVSMLV